jgi:hypothetical protein
MVSGGGGAAAGLCGAVLAGGATAGEAASAGFEGNGARTSLPTPAVGGALLSPHQE